MVLQLRLKTLIFLHCFHLVLLGLMKFLFEAFELLVFLLKLLLILIDIKTWLFIKLMQYVMMHLRLKSFVLWGR